MIRLTQAAKTVSELEAENASLRAALDASRASESRLREALSECGTLLQQVVINAPYDEPRTIEKPKLLLAQAWAFWEARQRILVWRELQALKRKQAASALADSGKQKARTGNDGRSK